MTAGLQATRAFRPDLIVLDFFICCFGSEDVLRKLMADEETRHIPVILDARGGIIDVEYWRWPFENLVDFIEDRHDMPQALVKIQEANRLSSVMGPGRFITTGRI